MRSVPMSDGLMARSHFLHVPRTIIPRDQRNMMDRLAVTTGLIRLIAVILGRDQV